MAQKEVYFGDYCPKCKHYDTPEDDDPCNECLNNPSNEDSHKPVRWQKGESESKKKKKKDKS